MPPHKRALASELLEEHFADTPPLKRRWQRNVPKTQEQVSPNGRAKPRCDGRKYITPSRQDPRFANATNSFAAIARQATGSAILVVAYAGANNDGFLRPR